MFSSAPSVCAPLTQRQEEVLEFITHFIEHHRYAPTYRELGDHFQVTLNGIRGHLMALQRKGYVEWQPHCARTLRVCI